MRKFLTKYAHIIVLVVLVVMFCAAIFSIAYVATKRENEERAACKGTLVILLGKRVCARIELLDEHKGHDHDRDHR